MRVRVHSLRFRILLVVLGTSMPALLVFFALNTFAVRKIEERIYENNLNLLNVHMSELEAELETASGYLISESIDKTAIHNFSSDDERERYDGTIAYHLKHVNTIHQFEVVEGQIIYSEQNGNLISYFSTYAPDYQQREQVLRFVKEHVEELSALAGKWKTYQIGDEWILIGAAGDERALFCFWTTYDLLMKPAEKWKLSDKSYFCFTDSKGTLLCEPEKEVLRTLAYDGDLGSYYYSGREEKYIMSGVESSIGDFRLMSAVEKNSSLGIFQYIRVLGVLLFLTVLFGSIPYIIRVLNTNIFRPVDRLERGIREVESGNLEVQVESLKSSREIEHLIQSFNEMAAQIHGLKIHAYEDELQRQRMELDYLQLQIEPHFYLNALNLINVMAQMGDKDMIREMTENLSQYMRYLVGSRKQLVSLKEELEHVHHYLKIMELRNGDGFHYEERIEDGLLSLCIPPLTIQTLVENSMKYAFDVYRETFIRVEVRREGETVFLRVTDNGPGYAQEVLERFGKNLPVEGNHIGMRNLRSRLEMMFSGKAAICISNLKPQGACTEIRIEDAGLKDGGKRNEPVNC